MFHEISVKWINLTGFSTTLFFFLLSQVVNLENHVIELFFERRRSGASCRSSIRSRTSSETFRDGSRSSVTPRSSFRDGESSTGTLRRRKSSKAAMVSEPVDEEKPKVGCATVPFFFSCLFNLIYLSVLQWDYHYRSF